MVSINDPAQTVSAGCRTIGPFVSGALFSLGAKVLEKGGLF